MDDKKANRAGEENPGGEVVKGTGRSHEAKLNRETAQGLARSAREMRTGMGARFACCGTMSR